MRGNENDGDGVMRTERSQQVGQMPNAYGMGESYKPGRFQDIAVLCMLVVLWLVSWRSP